MDKKSLAAADRGHLHHRLLDIGLSHRQSVAVLYALTAVFGLTSLFLGTWGKFLALGALLVVMIVLGWMVVRNSKIKKEEMLRSKSSGV
jgi:UDP-GlcNAc:undecaprenyl-phosphate GlcNAc-1-phosphate transferase